MRMTAIRVLEKPKLKNAILIEGLPGVGNIGKIAAAGADTFVAGSAIFGATDYRATIAAMRREIVAA